MEWSQRDSTSEEKMKNGTNKIIIPSQDFSYKFQTGTYREDILGKHISKLDYEKIISKASKLMENSWIKKRHNDLIKTPKLIIYLSIVAMALMCMYLVLIYISATLQNGDGLFIISITCVVILVLIIIGLSIYNFFRKEGKCIGLDEIVRIDIDNLFVEVNRMYKGKLRFKYDADVRNIICRAVQFNVKDDREERVLKTEENRFLR